MLSQFERVEQQKQYDDEMLSRALQGMYASVTGDSEAIRLNELEQASDALATIMAYYRLKPPEEVIPAETYEQFVRNNVSASDLLVRKVHLPKRWYKETTGCMLGALKDGSPVALIPTIGGYRYYHYGAKTYVFVTKDVAERDLESVAFYFYKPLPEMKLTLRDFLVFAFGSLRRYDYLVTLLSALAVTLVGLLVPISSSIIFHAIVPNLGIMGDEIAPIAYLVVILLISISVAQALLAGVRKLVQSRASTQMRVTATAAVMARMINLPTSFFKRNATGSLAQRILSIDPALEKLQQLVFGTFLTGVFCFVYLIQMRSLSPGMIGPVVVITAVSFTANAVVSVLSSKRMNKVAQASLKSDDIETSILMGVQKIKAAGAEKRAYAKWSSLYSKGVQLQYGNSRVLVWGPAITTLVTTFGLIAIYFTACEGGVGTAADYMVFASSYGLVQSAMATVNTAVSQYMQARPLLLKIEPILAELPESNRQGLKIVEPKGRIELENVSFSYEEEGKELFKGLDLRIEPGEYVGIVGKSGCGKSTIMRIILGFEKPQGGAVYIDGHNMAGLDLEYMRRHVFGAVMQSGKLFQGTVYQNIAIACPGLTVEEAWEATKIAGIYDDIKALPMGMNTFVGIDGNGISGGQKQRILIARAIASKPHVLLMDEATNALDNITQKNVADALANLNCTRIVVAHRLSTVKECDRIVVIDEGKIIEEGSYEKLLEQNGAFAALVKRQLA